jgi:hypothetical protein
MKVAKATKLHTAASARHAMMVAVRRFTLQRASVSLGLDGTPRLARRAVLSPVLR